jgi:deoxyribodipyrimidine photo-lyase
MRTLVLFTRDLRVHDHPALAEAAHIGEVLPLFVRTPASSDGRKTVRRS